MGSNPHIHNIILSVLYANLFSCSHFFVVVFTKDSWFTELLKNATTVNFRVPSDGNNKNVLLQNSTWGSTRNSVFRVNSALYWIIEVCVKYKSFWLHYKQFLMHIDSVSILHSQETDMHIIYATLYAHREFTVLLSVNRGTIQGLAALYPCGPINKLKISSTGWEFAWCMIPGYPVWAWVKGWMVKIGLTKSVLGNSSHFAGHHIKK